MLEKSKTPQSSSKMDVEACESWAASTPWTDRDAWFVTALFLLLAHLVVLSASMLGIAEMFSILMALEWKRAGWQALGFRRFDRSAVKLVCKLMLVGYVVVGVHNALLNYLHFATYPRQIAQVLGGSRSLWWIFPNIVLVGPFAEEVLFRGIVFAGFRQRYGWKKAAVISAGLFALAHMQLSAFVPAFVFGYIFAYLYEQVGSIWPGIITHCLINALGFFATFSRFTAT